MSCHINFKNCAVVGVISGFSRRVNGIGSLLGCYAVLIGQLFADVTYRVPF
jgi:hypothetical protein